MAPRDDLTGLLDRIEDRIDGDYLTAGDMVEAMSHRGFGPMLLVPALLVLLPTGAIPGVPSAMAIVIMFTAGQLIFGKKHPWLPKKVRQMRIERQKYETAYRYAVPVTRRIDRLLYPRLTVLAKEPAPRLIAALCFALSLFMIPLELLPFAAAVPAIAIAFMGLGLSVRDGALILIGLTVAVGGLGSLAWTQF